MLGTGFTPKDIVSHLERSGFGATIQGGGGGLKVEIPAYRLDILHPIDLVEDVAVGYGYDRFGGALPDSFSMGIPLARRSRERRLRMLMAGLGFAETKSLTLSSEDEQYVMLHRPITDPARILNPITSDHTILRTSVLPSLLTLFKVNKHRDLPQSIYELGDVVIGGKNAGRLAFAEISSDASFTRAKSLVQGLLAGVGLSFELEESLDEAFIMGRQAQLMVERKAAQGEYGGGKDALGVFGEVHPRALDKFELRYPVIAAELDMDVLLRHI
jgi:phenylalanyl-tRNA synthetase beta chain